jgi:hypothetical protein
LQFASCYNTEDQPVTCNLQLATHFQRYQK